MFLRQLNEIFDKPLVWKYKERTPGYHSYKFKSNDGTLFELSLKKFREHFEMNLVRIHFDSDDDYDTVHTSKNQYQVYSTISSVLNDPDVRKMINGRDVVWEAWDHRQETFYPKLTKYLAKTLGVRFSIEGDDPTYYFLHF